jgi:hypothetical protein
MADNTLDNSTNWTGFGVHCFQRATRSAFNSFPEVERVIERVTLEEAFSGKLDIRWRDEYGREYFGVPFGCGSKFGFTSPYHYDQSADALKPWNRSGLVGSGPVLYRPQVRERVRSVNDNQTIDVALGPTASEASDTARVEGRVTHNIALAAGEAADSAQVEGIIQSEVALVASEAVDTGRVEVHAHDKWIWQVDPSKRANDGTVPRKVQLACQRFEHEGKLKPSIQGLSVTKAREALEKAGERFNDSAVRRAFGRP